MLRAIPNSVTPQEGEPVIGTWLPLVGVTVACLAAGLPVGWKVPGRPQPAQLPHTVAPSPPARR